MTEKELIVLFEKHGIDRKRFGTGTAKSLEDLLGEIANGESALIERDGQLTRRIRVLCLDVFASIGGRVLHLVEDRQVFADGRTRSRQHPVSIGEKLHPDEDPLEAVARALEEELGIDAYALLTPEPSRRIEEKLSPSYPGLLSEYVMYDVSIRIAASAYRAEGYREVQEDKTTYFVWEPAP